jgi:hypothetical protein
MYIFLSLKSKLLYIFYISFLSYLSFSFFKMQILFTNPIAIIYFKTHLLTIKNKKTPLKNQEFHNITDIKTHNERQLQRSFISKGLLSKEKNGSSDRERNFTPRSFLVQRTKNKRHAFNPFICRNHAPVRITTVVINMRQFRITCSAEIGPGLLRIGKRCNPFLSNDFF